MSTFTPFVDLLAARTREARIVTYHVTEDWQQGRTAYGGLIAALAAQAMRDVAGAGWPSTMRLRALQTNFIGPVAVGPFEVAVQVLREGKSVSQVQATVTSAGQVAAVLVGVYGNPRATTVRVLAPAQPAVTFTSENAPSRPYVPGQSVSFLQHFHFGWAAGDPPVSGGSGWFTSIHVRLLGDRADSVDRDVLTVLLADLPPTPALSHFKQFAPASSVSWALELLPQDTPVGADDCWRIDTEAHSAADGYVNHSSTLWSAAGQAVAFGHQVVAIYG